VTETVQSNQGGKGGASSAALPISPTSRSDLRLLAAGLRRGWEFPETFLRVLPNALLEIVVKRDPDSQVYRYTPRERIAASRVLALMHGQNQKQADSSAPPTPQLHLHEHRHSVTLEDRRQTYLARLDHAGDGG